MTGRSFSRISMLMLAGVPVGIVVFAIWQTIVKTGPSVADDERIRGWVTVVRDLPATLLLFGVVATGLAFAVRAGRAGSEAEARRAILWHGVALLLGLLIVINGSAENIMTTRPATMKWLMLPIQVGVAVGVVTFCRRRAHRLR